MSTKTSEEMGKVTTTITVSNRVDQILAERGFIPANEIRSITLQDVLVDTGATRLCLPAEIIRQLGVTVKEEIEVKTAVGISKVRVFKDVVLSVEEREGTYTCVELPEGQDPLLGLIPLEDLALEPDLKNQRLRKLPVEGKDTYHTVM
ncbi:retroviral-like aspartic protease family protein [Aerosakkonema funiforme]|uniref:Retroviral-like aspartic protease family protein n=1 Tax=Aerosakkonema funiforme FACHB-1375 TaxID=2949571 RepID=A0A926VLS0_9CYAN|nr:retroviral-like aspartic protease family protein [Aerosakkonema funiforme]MBD2186064.1 retroviral-like aspartic protease family protein [Aerosakkonema funiforme FACHB-1375]